MPPLVLRILKILSFPSFSVNISALTSSAPLLTLSG